MKYLFAFSLIIINSLYALNNSEKEKVRYSFYSAIVSKDSMVEFKRVLLELKKSNPSSNFLLLYFGAYETLEAKHSWNLYEKYVKLKSGLEKINNVINNDPNNLEFRFIRFSILHYIPSILGYDALLKEDLQEITKLLFQNNSNEVSSRYKKGIIEFLFRSKRLDENSYIQLNSLYRNLQ